VNQDRGLGSLSRHELTGRDGKKHTRAESHEERGGHEEVVLGKNEAHGLSDERVHQETRDVKSTDILSVLTFLNESFMPLVLRSIPGLSARKRTEGMATFWEVSRGSI